MDVSCSVHISAASHPDKETTVTIVGLVGPTVGSTVMK